MSCDDGTSGEEEHGISTLLRAVVILLAAWIGMRSGYFSFPGIIIGILGLKISAYFHAYTNVYITKKLYKKGR